MIALRAQNNALVFLDYPMNQLQAYNMHPVTCIFGDLNPPFWMLNCGAYICNQCITNFAVRYSYSPFTCPCCTNIGNEFQFINRYRNGPHGHNAHVHVPNRGPQVAVYQQHIPMNNYMAPQNMQINQNVRNVNPNQNVSYHAGNRVISSEICNICFERPQSTRLNCESNSNHLLCETCFHQLINIQRIQLCPFCRTSIRI
jgi:hypothetical protein